ncbi:MAG: hypothetical protein ABIN74_14520 [Ferruginibacter sp.]
MKQKNFFGFLFAGRVPLYLIVSVLSGMAYWMWFKKSYSPDLVTDIMNFITLLTFIAALFIGWFEAREEFESGLLKLLSVRFLVNGKLVMVCKRAGLSHDTDIRAWVQQIGIQMTGQNLKFTTGIQPSVYKLRTYKYKGKKRKFKCFYYELELKEIKINHEVKDKIKEVAKQTELDIINKKANEEINASKYLVWDAWIKDEGYDVSNFKTCPDALPKLNETDKL